MPPPAAPPLIPRHGPREGLPNGHEGVLAHSTHRLAEAHGHRHYLLGRRQGDRRHQDQLTTTGFTLGRFQPNLGFVLSILFDIIGAERFAAISLMGWSFAARAISMSVPMLMIFSPPSPDSGKSLIACARQGDRIHKRQI